MIRLGRGLQAGALGKFNGIARRRACRVGVVVMKRLLRLKRSGKRTREMSGQWCRDDTLVDGIRWMRVDCLRPLEVAGVLYCCQYWYVPCRDASTRGRAGTSGISPLDFLPNKRRTALRIEPFLSAPSAPAPLPTEYRADLRLRGFAVVSVLRLPSRHCQLLLQVALAESAAIEFVVSLLIRPWIHAASRAVKEVKDDKEETGVAELNERQRSVKEWIAGTATSARWEWRRKCCVRLRNSKQLAYQRRALRSQNGHAQEDIAGKTFALVVVVVLFQHLPHGNVLLLRTCIYLISRDERFISIPTLAESLFIKRWLAKPSDLYKVFGQAPSVNDGATPIMNIVASTIKSNSICPFSLTVALSGIVGTEESFANGARHRLTVRVLASSCPALQLPTASADYKNTSILYHASNVECQVQSAHFYRLMKPAPPSARPRYAVQRDTFCQKTQAGLPCRTKLVYLSAFSSRNSIQLLRNLLPLNLRAHACTVHAEVSLWSSHGHCEKIVKTTGSVVSSVSSTSAADGKALIFSCMRYWMVSIRLISRLRIRAFNSEAPSTVPPKLDWLHRQ
ncbi:hypothetical protein KCU83_g162, partial [Aureobasidium melanogenum]